MSDKSQDPFKRKVQEQKLDRLSVGGRDQRPVWNGSYAPILKKFQDLVSAKNSGGDKKQYKLVILRPKPGGIPENPPTATEHQNNIKTFQPVANFSNNSVPPIFSSIPSYDVCGSPTASVMKTEICDDNPEPSRIASDSGDDPGKNCQSYQTFQYFNTTTTSGVGISPISQEIKSEDFETDPASSLWSQQASVPCVEPEKNSENGIPPGQPPYFTHHTCTSEVSTISEIIKSEIGEEDRESAQLTAFSAIKQEGASDNCTSVDQSLHYSQDVSCGTEVSEFSQETKSVYFVDSNFSSYSEHASISSIELGRLSADSYTLTAVPSHFNSHSSLPLPEGNDAENSSTVHTIENEEYSEFSQTSQLQSDNRSMSKELILTEHHVPVKFKPAITNQIESLRRKPCQTVEHASDVTNERTNSLDEFMQTGKFFKCGLCDSAFSEFSDLGRHFKTQHSRVCHICSKTIPISADLATHLLHCQPTQQGPLYAKCCICSKQVKDKTLGAHYRIHGIMLQEIMFRCDTCGRDVPFWKRNIICVHPNDQPSVSKKLILKCLICQMKFYELQSLHDHMKEAHAISLPETFPCLMCSKVYKRKHNLQRHMERHERSKQRQLERQKQRQECQLE